MRRTLTIGVSLLVLGVLAACAALRPDKLIRIASGATSQNICSGTFVSGLDPTRVYEEEVRPEGGMGLIAWALDYRVDRNAKRVTTTVFGTFDTSSAFHSGYGCRLEYANAVTLPLRPAHTHEKAVNDIAGADLVPPVNQAIARALEVAFAPKEGVTEQSTRAIVVVHNGRIVAERYGADIGIDTPLLSHSIAKSVMNALVGILVRDGKLTAEQTVVSPAWTAPLSVDQLLRMTSGLPLDEGRGPGLAQEMWFTQADNAAFAGRTPLAAKPGEEFAYGNLGYAVLSQLVRDHTGGKAEVTADFARRELFEPLGMSGAFMEFDSAGAPMGANAFCATARDWARFGLLYLNDGVANGKRILPEGWVDYTRRQSLDTGYGAGFWLNVTDSEIKVWPGAHWGMPGAPNDAYFARGYLGQFIVIVPSQNLVVVRLGVSHEPGGDIVRVGQLVKDVIEALEE